MNNLSLRDPSNCVFEVAGQVYRSLDRSYLPHYKMLMRSGLYAKLIEEGLLIPHEELDQGAAFEAVALQVGAASGAKSTLDSLTDIPSVLGTASELRWLDNQIIKPERVPFITYPYEWCFGELKDAALATLRIQKLAMDFGMSLKDASAFNIQFYQGRPLLIDTGSFEPYRKDRPWIAYSQFLRQFLGPLVLMSKVSPELNKLLLSYSDGLPLNLVRSMVPWYSWLNLSLAGHFIGSSVAQNSAINGGEAVAKKAPASVGERSSAAHTAALASPVKMPQEHLYALIDNLSETVKALKLPRRKTIWSNYYEDNSYTEAGRAEKLKIVESFIARTQPKVIWDIGANNGLFSEQAAKMCPLVVSMDLDSFCVEDNYLRCRRAQTANILPLVVDLMVPTPSAGWSNKERVGLAQRGPADLIMALALIHHLSIGNNISLKELAVRFSTLCRYLLIEFVPKSDVQVKRMLSQREDIFQKYDAASFENYFTRCFDIVDKKPVPDSDRVVYLLRSRAEPEAPSPQ